VLQEMNTHVYQFLGEAKYVPVLNAIYAGLGIPQTLTGNAQGGSGFTNNFVSLKTLIERLEYGRDVLRAFWEGEMEMIRKARGFRLPAELHFDHPTLSDEAAEKQLLFKLAEGNYISSETLLERFGEKPVIERTRVKNEYKMRKSGRMVRKASPYENPDPEFDFKKIVLQTGQATPSEVGLELEENKKGEVSMLDQQSKLQEKQMNQDHELAKKQQVVDHELQRDQHEHNKMLKEKKQVDDQKIKRAQIKIQPKGRPGEGRPSQSKDKQKRKQKNVTVRKSVSSMDLEMWAFDAQKQIYDMVTDAYLTAVSKKNVRSLSALETKGLEDLKFSVFWGTDPYTDISKEYVATSIASGVALPEDVYTTYSTVLKDHKGVNIDAIRHIQLKLYTENH